MRGRKKMKNNLWRVDGPAHHGRVVTDDDDRIIVAEDLSISHANLIAAAPEMLRALEQSLHLCRHVPSAIVTERMIRAALAKAKGAA